MRKILGRLVVLGAAAGAAYALRSYLESPAGPRKGDVQVVLDSGAIVEPDPAEAREFVEIARKALEIGGEAR